MYIGLVLLISISMGIQVYKTCYGKVVNIPKKEIYSQYMENENIFIRTIVSSEEEYKLYAEKYNLNFEIAMVDFSKNSIFISSKHEAKVFSYNEKNRRYSRSNQDILDVIFYKNETRRIYIYEIPININTWESTGANKKEVFE